MAEPGSVQIFQTLTEQVSTWVPEDLLSEVVLKSDKFQDTISLQWSVKIDKFWITLVFLIIFGFGAGNALAERTVVFFGVFDAGNKTGFSKVLGDTFGNREGSGDKGLTLDLFSVFELNINKSITVTVISGLGRLAKVSAIFCLMESNIFNLR